MDGTASVLVPVRHSFMFDFTIVCVGEKVGSYGSWLYINKNVYRQVRVCVVLITRALV